MLKENQGSKKSENSLDFFPFKSLYHVLDSMQGLREVIEEVSLDEIIEADKKAKRLIERLSSVQTSLANLDATKQFLAKAKATFFMESPELPSIYTTLPNLDAIKSLLAKFKDPKNDVERDLEDFSSLDPTTQFLAKVQETIANERVEEHGEPPTKDTSRKLSQNYVTKVSGNVIHFPASSKITKEPAKSGSADSPLEEALSLAENRLTAENSAPKTTTEHATNAVERTPTTLGNNFTLPERQFGEQKPEGAFSLNSIDENEPESAARKEASSARNTGATPESLPPKKEREPTKLEISFDEDLLNKLIKDYGEFTIYTKLSAEPRAETTVGVNSGDIRPQLGKQAALKANPSYDRNQSWHRKEEDLDEQLKRLMKDYGKIDKYSTKKGDKLKKIAVAIAALAVISVISGLFLNSRNSIQPTVETKVIDTPIATRETSGTVFEQPRSTEATQRTNKK